MKCRFFPALAGLLFSLAAGMPVARAEVPYLDDRSDAAVLVRSLYNAINRHEYARAFDYFSKAPAKSFEAYAEGYATTRDVELAVGPVFGEGVAGTSMYTVPVAIKSTAVDGSEKVFAGCYVVRQANPQIQDPPFRALQIESGKLSVSDAPSVLAALPNCGMDHEEDDAVSVAEASRAYLAVFGETCSLSPAVASGKSEPDVYKIDFKRAYADASAAPETAQLFRFSCALAAYNETHVFFLKSGNEPLQPLALAEPVLKIDYEDQEGAVLKAMAVAGYETQFEAVNSDFDPANNSLSTFSKWRGLGDSSSNAQYVFQDGRFVLWLYDADPTSNGEMDPLRLIENGVVLVPPKAVE